MRWRLQALIREVGAMISASAYKLFLGSRIPRKHGLNPTQLSAEQLSLPVVLFAHGAGDTSWGWRSHAKALRVLGLPLFTLPSHSEQAYREALDRVLRFCRDQGMRGDIPLILVGHSLGAIRHYGVLQDGVEGARVEQLFAIAGRSRVNTRWLRPLFARLIPTLRRIDRGFVKKEELLTRVVTVVSEQDWLVPPEAAERGEVLSLFGEGHLSVKDAPETVIALVRSCKRLTTRIRTA